MANEGKLEDELTVFRQQWQEELNCRASGNSSASGSRTQSPVQFLDTSKSLKDSDNHNAVQLGSEGSAGVKGSLEDKARRLFLQGVAAERSGNTYEAIYFYRQAIQLVPDIESKISDYTVPSSDEEEDNEAFGTWGLESSHEDTKAHKSDPHLMELAGKFHQLSVSGVCQPNLPTKATHISAIPVELMMYIFRWVASSEIDMKSIEMLSRVCKGFYACARDSELWRLACLRIWGVNCGPNPISSDSTWRLMFIERPHLWFHGVYISRASYVREGERSLDTYYRAFHMVYYYRYMRFFNDGTVLFQTSPDEPITALPRMKRKIGGGHQSVLTGNYRLSGEKVIIMIEKNHSASSDAQNVSRGRRGRRYVPPTVMKQVFHLELAILSKGRHRHKQLRWSHYSCHTTYSASNETVASDFDLTKQFPNLCFSVVKSYTQHTTAPL